VANLYEGEMGYRSKPMMVKYFTNNNLKVLDCSSGYYSALVKVKDNDGKCFIYAFSQSEENRS